MAQLMDGKLVSQSVRDRIREQAAGYRVRFGTAPGLAVVLVGGDPASKIYVNNKKKACAEVGFGSFEYLLPEDCPQEELIALVHKLNADPRVNGILVQLPLPRHIDEIEVIRAIDPAKDVDAFSERNVGRIMIGNYDFLPCTPAGVMEMLRYYKIDPAGKEAVVVGRSNIVGKPQALLLLQANATVTICHSKTRDLAEVTRRAEILVVAIGRGGFITGDMVRESAVVVDVGMNRNPEGKLVGDVDFAAVEPRASYITPVPGGVGPMTIAMLLQNTLTAYKRLQGIE